MVDPQPPVWWRLRTPLAGVPLTWGDALSPNSQPTQYRAADLTSRDRMIESLLVHVYRHDEPYVDECLREASRLKGINKPRRYEAQCHSDCLALAADLPLWAVVDSFSLGLLGQFLMNCDTDNSSPVWKAVAKDLDISAQVFETQVKSLAYLRNSVAHHARLWMRPTSDSAKKPPSVRQEAPGSSPQVDALGLHEPRHLPSEGPAAVLCGSSGCVDQRGPHLPARNHERSHSQQVLVRARPSQFGGLVDNPVKR